MEIRLPPDQEARLVSVAADTGRSTDELVHEAVTLWEAQRLARPEPKRNPAEAAARLRRLRKGNLLPEGETLKDLINHGRA